MYDLEDRVAHALIILQADLIEARITGDILTEAILQARVDEWVRWAESLTPEEDDE